VRLKRFQEWLVRRIRRTVPGYPLVILLSCVVGASGGFGAVFFSWLIQAISSCSVEPLLGRSNPAFLVLLCLVPGLGLLVVAWFTRRFAPEAAGHGVPEVIVAVARHDGVIRPRVSVVKILASALCIGTGGSVGCEGPIVQIGSSVGSASGQLFRLSAPNIKVLVACGAAAAGSDVAPQLLMASDIATDSPISIFPDDNLLEALRDFATPDVESLPVEERQGQSRRLVGLLFRADVMRRYREELLRNDKN